MYKYISNSEKETIELGKTFSKELKRNDIVVLSGDLGAGKTKFVQGILEAYGLEKEISSPTFTIVNEYDAKHFSIYHFDLYRLNNIDEFYEMGGDEYFTKGGICIIEWGEEIEPILNGKYFKISILRDPDNENSRTILIDKYSKKGLRK